MALRRIDSRQRILEAYERAKSNDPTLTQGRFMRQGAPGYTFETYRTLDRYERVGEGRKAYSRLIPGKHIRAPGKFKSDDSAARYFRKIRSGERSGAAMYEAGTQDKPGRNIGLFQVRARLADGRVISQNIDVSGAMSTFDDINIEYLIKTRNADRMEALILHYQSRYGMDETDVDMESLEVRPIHHQRRPIRMRLSV